ncbi:CubicO group peptidase (beta-lactamase class C family) [Crossiella equi]|uniref:CubicO group peptidase (Beta-lactamase class C family) n=1 Tax=Crossiella equi TaxID=130796 RepID=A0ABS5AS87_9PSEU|nr:serine hydrolase domain-containing protein [Crossiella equi]MBP2479286.1 CubicO group peptidase (beta-lactamase class C family) [Crossiella equi]
MPVHGLCAPRFAEVRAEFERNFAQRGETGASVHVTLDGEPVVDLWGGLADPGTGRRWTDYTFTHVWTATQGATALCAHVLAARGHLEMSAPVSRYWPEFAKGGKDGVLVAHLLNHQAGLPGLRDQLPRGAFYDWEQMTERLAAEEPLWAPGTRHGYHPFTFGFLVGELVRRVTGGSLAQFFEREIAGPLDLDFWLTLPEELDEAAAPVLPTPHLSELIPSMHLTALTDPDSPSGRALLNTGGYLSPGEADSRAARAAVLGGTGGLTNARGLACLYRPLALGGAVDGLRLVERCDVARAAAVSSASGSDAVTLVPTRFSLGFAKAVDNRHLPPADRDSLLWSEDAFGACGTGGSVGFADPAARLSFGYVTNRQGSGLGLNERGQSLIDATYRALGHRRLDGGLWYR